MSNEFQLNSNSKLVNFTSNYEYVLGATQGRLLEFEGLFHSMDFLYPQLEQIAIDLEDTAKMYAEQQGLSPGAQGWGIRFIDSTGEPVYRINTGRLYHGIKSEITGQRIHLKSEAQDEYGHYYGGHVEYGHQDVPARPHLRPALYTVSQASQGKLKSALRDLLIGTFNGDMRLAFGTGGGLSASYYRKGAGNIRQTMTKGTIGRQMKYHFGSIRRSDNISRKAASFRANMASTAKRSAGWGKQKSLNQAQRYVYRTRGSKMRYQRKSEQRRNLDSVKKSGISASQYRKLKSGTAFPAQQMYKGKVAQSKAQAAQNLYFKTDVGQRSLAESAGFYKTSFDNAQSSTNMPFTRMGRRMWRK